MNAKTFKAMGSRGLLLDLSSFSNALVHVRPAGEVELVFHAFDAVGEAEVEDLRAMGAEIVNVLEHPGLVQVWLIKKQRDVHGEKQFLSTHCQLALTPLQDGEIGLLMWCLYFQPRCPLLDGNDCVAVQPLMLQQTL